MSREYGKDITVGCYVELSPHFDLWMRGARFGIVKEIVGGIASVKMDHPEVKKIQKVYIDDLKRI